MQAFLDTGFKQEDLLGVQSSLNAVNKSAIRIVGGFFAMLQGATPEGDRITAHSMIYVTVSPEVADFSCLKRQ
jgi:hypothetical protein